MIKNEENILEKYRNRNREKHSRKGGGKKLLETGKRKREREAENQRGNREGKKQKQKSKQGGLTQQESKQEAASRQMSIKFKQKCCLLFI